MYKHRLVRFAAVTGLTVALAFSLTGGPALAETKLQFNEKLDTLKQKQTQNERELNDAKAKLKQNNRQQDSAVENLQASVTKIAALNRQIAAKQASVRHNRASAAQLKRQIDRLTKRIDKRGELLKGRVRSIYINGGAVSYLDVIMGSKNFGDFLDRLLVVKTITDQDHRILDAQRKDKAAHQEKRKTLTAQLESEKRNLAALQVLGDHLQAEKRKQDALLVKLKKQGTEIESLVMDQSEEKDVLAAQAAVIRRQMNDMADEKAKEQTSSAERKKDEATKDGVFTAERSGSSGGGSANANDSADKKAVAPGKSGQASETKPATIASSATKDRQKPSALASSTSSSGQFAWPAAGSVSSGYGYRSFDHGFHPGIDIAGAAGTPITAAADGVVFRAYRSSSYGNCVMISHVLGGRTYTTVYAHLSRIDVSDGQSVSRGQVIGAMGATGEAFGTHLHFELYVGRWTPPPHHGTVDPLHYLR